MLLATILFLCPMPQSGDIAKAEVGRPAVVATASEDSAEPKALPAAPAAKIKTDSEVANDATGASSSSSSSSASSSSTPTPAVEPAPANPGGVAPVKTAISAEYDTEHQKKEWYALMAVSSGAAVFDAWSTRRAISGGYGTEANPLLKPFANSNAIYAATQVSPLVLDLIGRKMMTSRHSWMRKFWWVPQLAGTDVSVSAGIHNVSLVH